jgi:hypothetical protein
MRWLALAWLVVSGLGVRFTRLALNDAYQTRRALVASGKNGRAKLLVDAKVRSAWLRLYFKLVCFLIGVSSFWLPPDRPENGRRFRGVAGWLLLSVIALLNAETWLTLRDTERLRLKTLEERARDSLGRGE